MTHDRYKKLSPVQQELFMWYYGVPVAKRIGKLYRYLLVQVESFYVEVEFLMYENVIRKFDSFDDTEKLWPYLEQIRIGYDE